jgi:hypothetical protein
MAYFLDFTYARFYTLTLPLHSKCIITRPEGIPGDFICFNIYFPSGDLIHVQTEITVSKTRLRHFIKKFPKHTRKTVDTHKVLITTIPFKAVPLGENSPNISAMIRSCPGSPSVSASSAPSTIQPRSRLPCQVFTPFNFIFILGNIRKSQGDRSGN